MLLFPAVMHSHSRMGRMVRFVVLVIGTATVAGCALPIVLLAESTERGDIAVRRAAREFSCPPSKIGALSRSDIAHGLVDVEACGRRARYICTWGPNVDDRCTREPDPARWDPDPALCRNTDGLKPKPAGCFEPVADVPARDEPVL